MRGLSAGVLLFLVSAGFSLASGAAEGGDKVSPFAGDIGNALWTLIIFVVVLVVLGKFAWGPILDSLQKRERYIRESLEQAKHDRESAEARLAETNHKLNTARQEATAIVEEGRRDAEVLKRQLENTTKTEAAAILDRAKKEIAIAKETAVKEIYSLSAKVATELAGRLVEKELDARHHERLIERSIAELKKDYASPAAPIQAGAGSKN